MALAQHPNYAGTRPGTCYEYDHVEEAKKLRLKLMREQCGFIEKRTLVGQHVFSLVNGSVVLDMPTGPVVLGTRQEPGPQTWRLEYDPEVHDAQLSSLQTKRGIIRTLYDNNSIEDMTSFRMIKGHCQGYNAGILNRFPQEVRSRIYEYAAARAFVVRDSEIFEVIDSFEFRDPVTKDFSAAKPSVLFNLQLTCSCLHDDVTQFLYDKNEFYFSYPDSIEHFLLCLQAGPLNVNQMRHLGVVILDLRRCISFPTSGHAWPALPLKNMEDERATPDWGWAAWATPNGDLESPAKTP